MINSTKNNRGFGLPTALMGVALTSLTALAIMHTVMQGLQGQAYIKDAIEATNDATLTRFILSNPQTCVETLREANRIKVPDLNDRTKQRAITKIMTKGASNKYVTFRKISQDVANDMTIAKIRLKNENCIKNCNGAKGETTYSGYLEIYYNRKISLMGGKQLVRPIPILYTFDSQTRRILDCSTDPNRLNENDGVGGDCQAGVYHVSSAPNGVPKNIRGGTNGPSNRAFFIPGQGLMGGTKSKTVFKLDNSQTTQFVLNKGESPRKDTGELTNSINLPDAQDGTSYSCTSCTKVGSMTGQFVCSAGHWVFRGGTVLASNNNGTGGNNNNGNDNVGGDDASGGGGSGGSSGGGPGGSSGGGPGGSSGGGI